MSLLLDVDAANIIASHSLILDLVALPFSLLLWRYQIHQRLMGFRVWSVKPEWGEWRVGQFSFYEFVSLAVTISFFVIELLFTHFDDNLLLLRVGLGNASDAIVGTAGHYLVWFFLFIVFVRYGVRDVLRGGYAMFFFASLHELGWYLAYMAANPENVWITLANYWPFIIFTGSLMTGYFLNFKNLIPRRKIILGCAFLALFYSLWAIAGFHVSLDNVLGKTQYYSSLDVALIEVLSWGVLALLLV